jgi:hypothetical protein
MVAELRGRGWARSGTVTPSPPNTEVTLVLSKLAYLTLCRSIQLFVLLTRGDAAKDLEILVLRHQLTVLRRQTPRPRLEPADRALLAAASRVLPRACWSCFFVKPETLLRWHRRLIAGAWTYPRRRLGRPQLDEDGQQLIVHLARENPRWGTTPPWHPDLGDHDPHDAAAPPAGPRATAGGHHLAGVSASTGHRDRRV